MYTDDPNYDPRTDQPGGDGSTPPTPDPSDPFADQLNALYQQYYHRNANPDELAAHRGNPGGLAAVEAILKQATAPTPPGPTPPGPGPGPGTLGSLTAPFTQKFAQPPNVGPPGLEYVPRVPTLSLPTFTPPSAYQSPSMADAQNSPGFQFRVAQGETALSHAAAAKGLTRSGGTLKDYIDYGQNAASQEYQNVDARARNTYQMNYASQYVDPFKFQYQAALDAFAPQMEHWRTLASAGQHQSDLNTATAFNSWVQDYNIFRNQQNDTFDKYYRYATG